MLVCFPYGTHLKVHADSGIGGVHSVLPIVHAIRDVTRASERQHGGSCKQFIVESSNYMSVSYVQILSKVRIKSGNIMQHET